MKKIFYSLVGCLLCLFMYWFTVYYKVQSPLEFSDSSKSILFWNIARKGEPAINIIIKKVKEQKPSFIALVEAEELTDKDVIRFKNTFISYSIQKLQGGMVIAVKGKINDIEYHCKDESFKFNHITVTLANQKKSILIADVNAVPFTYRKSALHTIYEFTIKKDPSFIVGDFNTPYESVHFGNYKNELNSFHSVSKGFTATWPYGIPLFEIDQIWSTKKIKPIFLKKEYHNISDHALLIGVYE
ncbi:endonuclease/exonuclease/phosphatase family protein [Aquimarina sp. MAR_2010_214]|uniref:endonuclease/exonuclease/phosphatase family protein n=1 Tax=Aquimarina sp. MAR_2010_214 TaxID=1250026 RepID=UPI0011786CA9|nr:endonuclease/exonuclease/phosphatase family protein [Aquimarina sp. MAR_2010_214]